MGIVESVILYFGVFLMAAVVYSVSGRLSIGQKKLYWIPILISCMIVGWLSGVRFNVGTDFQNYTYIYKTYAGYAFNQCFNVNGLSHLGVILFAKIAKFFGGQQVFFGLFGFCMCLLAERTFSKEYSNVSQFLLVFLFLLSPFSSGLNIIKQTMAMVICFYALKFVYQRKWWLYLLTIAVAVVFHPSAIVALIIYPIYNTDHTKNRIKKIIGLCAALGIVAFFDKILAFFVRFDFFSHFAMYLKDDSSQIRGLNSSFILNLVILVVFLLFRKALVAYDQRNDLLILMFAIGVVFELLGFTSAFTKRLALYFESFPLLVLMSNIPKIIKPKWRVVANALVIVYAMFMFVVLYAVLGQGEIIPFEFA